MSEPVRASQPSGDLQPAAASPGLWPDVLSGFLVFLIALPLCLAIAGASNFPPIAGIWTAIAGGLVATFISNSQLTIKGPAAGLIVIVLGAVLELGQEFAPNASQAEQIAIGYRLALGVGVASGIIQIIFGFFRAGKLGDFFPLAAVHGMLASIGIIIIAKQAYVALGAPTPKGEPLHLLIKIPEGFQTYNPAIAFIGVVSLVIMFGMPLIRNKYAKRIPAQMVVLLVAIPLGMALQLDHEHKYLFPDHLIDVFGPDGEEAQRSHMHSYNIGPKYLVTMPEVLKNPGTAFSFPDFRGLGTLVGLKSLVLFALIGTLESLLSAKAIDLLDPKKRKTDLNRDIMAIGVANTGVALIGGLPMISEIVRSSANITNGAQSRMANFFHGLFLLGFVLLFPKLIHSIPTAALAAMLIYTGFRLAHPAEFIKTWQVGKEQLVVFVSTILTTLATDLLIGIGVGIVVKFGLHLLHGMPLGAAFRPNIEVEQTGEKALTAKIHQTAVFTNWLPLKDRLTQLGTSADVTLDMSDVRYADHTVMEKLHELEREFEVNGGHFHIVGLENHAKLSRHPTAARKKSSGSSSSSSGMMAVPNGQEVEGAKVS